MKKKTLAMLLALVMVLGMLSACGQSEASAESVSAPVSEAVSEEAPAPEAEETVEEPAPAVEETSAAEASVAEPVEEVVEYAPIELPILEEAATYTMWTTLHPAYMNYVTDLADLTVWAEVANRTGIGFEFTAVSGITASDSFNLMIAGGDYCDVITEMDLFSEGIEAAVEQEIVIDLADKLPELAPRYWDLVCADASAYLTLVTDAGYVGTMATLRGEVGSTDLNGPMLRGDWLEEFGMETPVLLSDLEEYLRNATETYGAVSQFSNDGLDSVLLTSLNLSGDFIVKDGEVKSSYQEENFRTYLETAAKWYQEGLIDPDFYSIDDMTENATKMANGQYSLASNSAMGISRIMQYVTDPESTISLLPVAYTPVSEEEEIHVGQENSLIVDKDAWAVTTSCEDPDPLISLVDYMFTEEGQLLFNYGVEGETYELDAEGNPQWTEFVTADPEYAFDVQEYLYATATMPGIRDFGREMWNYAENELLAVEIYGNQGDCAYNYPSYAVMTADDSTAYYALESDLSTYVETTILAFITGQSELNDASWDEFQATLESMGIAEMITYKQNAYDTAIAKYESIG